MNEFTDDARNLAETTKGAIFHPDTDEYDAERVGFQSLGPHRPAFVVAAEGAEDIRAAVRFAAARRTRLAVQSSGHGLAAGLEGGVLVSTRRMDGVRVDPERRTAWIEAGASWGKVIAQTAPHGLAPLSGSSPAVGAISYTLGGGLGLLARRYGFAADHVRALDLVTPDGGLRRVDASDPDLFWALRGGGGGFGVVTGLEIGLVPVTHLYGGGLFFDVAEIPEILEEWRRWTETVPEEMTSAVAMLVMPDLPMVPEPLRRKHVAQIQISFLGSAEEGERLVSPLRALGPRLRETLRLLPYTESGSVFDEPDRPHGYRSANRLVNGLDAGPLRELTERAGPSSPMMCVVQLRHLGGALSRRPEVPSAVGHRDAAYSVSVLSMVDPGQETAARDLHRDLLAPFAGRVLGRSLNLSYGPLEEDEIRSGFDARDHRRLAELRDRLDPYRLIHTNHPIPPLPARP
jgi:hypothetical protein